MRVDGSLVSLEEQDRSAGTRPGSPRAAVLERALRLGGAGPYVVQAAIAALHAQAPTWAETDWPQIAGLYRELEQRDPSPVVTINRAVAVGFADGPAAGLAVLDGLAQDPRLDRYQPLYAARAELCRRAGDAAGAGAAYAEAIALTDNAAERRRAPRPPRRRLTRASGSPAPPYARAIRKCHSFASR